jgi:hypothetical protein
VNPDEWWFADMNTEFLIFPSSDALTVNDSAWEYTVSSGEGNG